MAGNAAPSGSTDGPSLSKLCLRGLDFSIAKPSSWRHQFLGVAFLFCPEIRFSTSRLLWMIILWDSVIRIFFVGTFLPIGTFLLPSCVSLTPNYIFLFRLICPLLIWFVAIAHFVPTNIKVLNINSTPIKHLLCGCKAGYYIRSICVWWASFADSFCFYYLISFIVGTGRKTSIIFSSLTNFSISTKTSSLWRR